MEEEAQHLQTIRNKLKMQIKISTARIICDHLYALEYHVHRKYSEVVHCCERCMFGVPKRQEQQAFIARSNDHYDLEKRVL